MLPHEAAALAVIGAEYGEIVLYTGAGLIGKPVRAVRSDVEAGEFPGAGSSARNTTFEIGQAELPGQPDKQNFIEENSRVWSVVDVVRRDDVRAWLLTVERAGGPIIVPPEPEYDVGLPGDGLQLVGNELRLDIDSLALAV